MRVCVAFFFICLVVDVISAPSKLTKWHDCNLISVTRKS